MSRRLTDKLIRNTFFNTLGLVWDTAVRLVLVPYVVTALGTERANIWVYIGTVTAQFLLLELGVETSLIRFVAQRAARGDQAGINRVMTAGIVFYAGFAVFVMVVACLGAEWITGLFDMDAALAGEMACALRWAGVALGTWCVVRVFEALFAGLQRMGTTNLIRMAISLPYIVMTVVVIEKGWGVRGLMIRDCLAYAIQLFTLIVAAYVSVKGLSINVKQFADRKTFRSLFVLGVKVHVSRLSLQANLFFDKFVAFPILDPTFRVGFVLFCDLATKILSIARLPASQLVSALLPATSELAESEDRAGVYHLFERSTRYLIFVGGPVFGAIVVGAPLIMRAWMGRPYPLSALTLQILAGGYFALSLSGAVGPAVLALDRPGIQVKSSLASLVMNVTLSLALLALLGYPGALLGTFLALVLSLLYAYALTLAEFDRSLSEFLYNVHARPLAALLGAGCLTRLVMSCVVLPSSAGRGMNFLLLVGVTLLYVAAFVVLALALRCFDKRDAELTRRLYDKMRGAIRVRPSSREHQT